MSLSSDELNFLKLLFETQSLSQTTTRLRLSLSKGSRLLAGLRRHFHDRLFIRADQRMCPTMRARELYPEVITVLKALERLEGPTEFEVERIHRVFSIGGLDNALLTYIRPILLELKERAPGIRLNFHSLTPNLYSDLQQGRIDLAIYATNESYPGFCKLPLCQDTYVFVSKKCSKFVDRLAKGEYLSESELCRYQTVQITLPKVSSDDCGLVPFVEHIQNPDTVPLLCAPYFVTVPLLLSGDETTYIPFQMAHVLEQISDIRILGRRKSGPVYSPCLIWADHARHDLAHQWLRSFLSDQIQKLMPSIDSIPVLKA